MTSTLSNPQKLSSLEAVNLILNAYGITSVAGLGSTPEAASAEEHLNRALIQLCLEGYNFSHSYEETWTPDSEGHIATGSNVVEIIPSGVSAGMDIVDRGQQLFDRKASTFEFANPVQVNVIRTVPFEELPLAASWYCAWAAAATFIGQNNSGDRALRDVSVALTQARILLEQHDARAYGGDLVDHNPHFARHRGRAKHRRGSV